MTSEMRHEIETTRPEHSQLVCTHLWQCHPLAVFPHTIVLTLQISPVFVHLILQWARDKMPERENGIDVPLGSMCLKLYTVTVLHVLQRRFSMDKVSESERSVIQHNGDSTDSSDDDDDESNIEYLRSHGYQLLEQDPSHQPNLHSESHTVNILSNNHDNGTHGCLSCTAGTQRPVCQRGSRLNYQSWRNVIWVWAGRGKTSGSRRFRAHSRWGPMPYFRVADVKRVNT